MSGNRFVPFVANDESEDSQGTSSQGASSQGTSSQGASYNGASNQSTSSQDDSNQGASYQGASRYYDSDSSYYEAYYSKGRYSGSGSSAGRGTSEHRVRMSEVNMPSGAKIEVTIPAKDCECYNECSFDVRMTLLRPEGQMGGREYAIVAQEMAQTIKRHAPRGGGGRFRSYNIIKVEKIQNCCLWKRFRKREKQIGMETGYVNERMLFHGSKCADAIAKTGFDQTCAKPGSMFGPAIYFAEHSSKSNQYAFGTLGGKGCPSHGYKGCYTCERKVLLCRVALGRMFFQTNVNQMTHLPSNFSSVAGEPSAGGLRYPEYAIYKGDQAYPEYLITYKIVR